jgi:hypothetical protein
VHFLLHDRVDVDSLFVAIGNCISSRLQFWFDFLNYLFELLFTWLGSNVNGTVGICTLGSDESCILASQQDVEGILYIGNVFVDIKGIIVEIAMSPFKIKQVLSTLM